MIIIGIPIVLITALIILIGLTTPDSGFVFAHFIVIFLFFIAPGALLIYGGRQLLKQAKAASADSKKSASAASANPASDVPEMSAPAASDMWGDSVKIQINQGSMPGISVDINNGWFAEELAALTSAPSASSAQKTASVSCSGCGAKVTVSPNQVSECEYCGTKVPYSAV